MALQWALAGNIVIALAYAAITVAITVPVLRAGQLRSNRLAVATALIFFSCAVGHALHAVMYWRASVGQATMPGMHDVSGWSLWPTAVWDMLTAAVGIFYWTLRRSYSLLLSGSGALFVVPQEQQRRHEIELRERVAEGRAQAEAERDAQRAMLSAVVSNSQSMVYVKDLQGRYLLVNKTFQESFGVTEAELLGHSDDYIDPVLAPVWQANDRLAHAGAVHVEETALVGGQQRFYETNKFPLFDAAGELYASCGVSLDVTELRRAAVVAEQARDEALAQSRIKSEFLATMSHEIRTPMNGVLGLSTLLTRTELSPVQRRYATDIHSAGTALLAVINDILDFSKIEAGRVLLDPADINLPELLDATVALIRPAAQAKGLVLRASRGTGLPTAVRGDGGRVRQILLNLTGNAAKFTAQGSVILRADLIDAARPTVRFAVTDTGIGIAAADVERLFEPFTQADASTTRTYGGTGLGLSISRRLTEAMGGTIGVDSEPGRGSTFWCEIPFEPAQGDAAGPTFPAAAPCVLVVGAGPGRAALENDLRGWEFTVATADTGPQALVALRDAAGQGRPYDVLLLDADPGDTDTGGLSRAVASDPAIPAPHVVILNAPTDLGDGATHLLKPVHRSTLHAVLAPGSGALAPATDGAATPAGRGTVLLVEDNDTNQVVALGLLTSLGYRADVAGDGLQACEMTAAGHYDAILMDCQMPLMDGFTATARLRDREQKDGTRTPIIAMTASALATDRQRCLAAGMDDYLAKPVDPVELAHALDRWVPAAASVPWDADPDTGRH